MYALGLFSSTTYSQKVCTGFVSMGYRDHGLWSDGVFRINVANEAGNKITISNVSVQIDGVTKDYTTPVKLGAGKSHIFAIDGFSLTGDEEYEARVLVEFDLLGIEGHTDIAQCTGEVEASIGASSQNYTASKVWGFGSASGHTYDDGLIFSGGLVSLLQYTEYDVRDSQVSFGSGYDNAYYNTTNSAVQLSGGTTGGYAALVDAGANAQWGQLLWESVLPLGNDLPDYGANETGANMSGNVLLLHFDNTSQENSTFAFDFSGSGNSANCSSCPTLVQNGRFAKGYEFDGTQNFNLPASNALFSSGPFSLELWFNTTVNHPAYGGAEGRMINLHRQNSASTAVTLYLEQNQLGVIYYDGSTHNYIRTNKNYWDGRWHHYAVTYDNSDYVVYYDGIEINRASDSFGPVGPFLAQVGSFDGTERYYQGRLDEIAVFNRTLSSDEIAQHYLRGAARINATARTCDDAQCSGESWTSATQSPLDISPVNRYLQYQINLSVESAGLSPGLENVTADWSSYNSSQPSVTPDDEIDQSGIVSWDGFSETATKNGGEIYYQLWNGSDWLYWSPGWAPASAGDNSVASVINSNIATFPKSSGKLNVRAFLVSDGAQDVQLDEIRVDYTYTT